jgi:hypothetical protein
VAVEGGGSGGVPRIASILLASIRLVTPARDHRRESAMRGAGSFRKVANASARKIALKKKPRNLSDTIMSPSPAPILLLFSLHLPRLQPGRRAKSDLLGGFGLSCGA